MTDKSTDKKYPILEHWAIAAFSIDEVKAGSFCILGEIQSQNNPSSPARRVQTSAVILAHGDNKVITSSGSIYELGSPYDKLAEQLGLKDNQTPAEAVTKKLPQLKL